MYFIYVKGDFEPAADMFDTKADAEIQVNAMLQEGYVMDDIVVCKGEPVSMEYKVTIMEE